MKSTLALIALAGILIAGCGKPQADVGKTDGQQAAKPGKTDDHSGWWCDEHGIPEHECSMCSPKVAAQKKKENDWCTKHNRADSQCFICHPEYKETYARLYRAKYGKEPPKPEE
jgi:nitrous oxide reductase accessory protein NosL